MLAGLKPRWEGAHGMNFRLAVYMSLDEAAIYLGAGQADVRTEVIISDAVGRLKVIGSNGRSLSKTKKQKHLAGLAYQQVGAVRALGKMHIMRKNYGAALELYREVALMAKEVFGSDAPSPQLAWVDYNRARLSGIELLTADYLSTAAAEEEIEMVDTILGKIARSKATFGRMASRVPVDRVPVYGLVPCKDLRWAEGTGTV